LPVDEYGAQERLEEQDYSAELTNETYQCEESPPYHDKEETCEEKAASLNF